MSENGFRRIAVCGGGAWGTTIAHRLAAKRETPVHLWAREPHVVAGIRETRFNDAFLPGIRLDDSLEVHSDPREAIEGADLLVLAIPVQFIQSTFSQIAPLIEPNTTIVSVAKGLERETKRTPSEIVQKTMTVPHTIACLSGPNIAIEIAENRPSVAVIASPDFRVLPALQSLISGPKFSITTSADMRGVELGGALKNVIALASGMVAGLGAGINYQSAVVAEGYNEILAVGAKLGANPETFTGPAGLGDLMTTCFSEKSRNFRFGYTLARVGNVEQAVHSLGGHVAEGVATAQSLYELTRELSLRCPIVDITYRILYENGAPDLLIDSMREFGFERSGYNAPRDV